MIYRYTHIVFFILIAGSLFGQEKTGVNTTTPAARLHVEPEATPNSTTGIKIPSVYNFPVTDPSAEQQGMLIFYDKQDPEEPTNEGFYFWNNPESRWEYIIDFRVSELDASKIISTAYDLDPGSVDNGETASLVFEDISTLDPNFLLDNGNIIIGETGQYEISLIGSIQKGADNNLTRMEVEVLINGTIVPNFTAQLSAPGGANDVRENPFQISGSLPLSEGDELSIRLTKISGAAGTELSVASPFTVSISKLN